MPVDDDSGIGQARTTPPNVSRSVARASIMGNSAPSLMCHANRRCTAVTAMAVMPVDARIAAIL